MDRDTKRIPINIFSAAGVEVKMLTVRLGYLGFGQGLAWMMIGIEARIMNMSKQGYELVFLCKTG
jgi:hypothetical protein